MFSTSVHQTHRMVDSRTFAVMDPSQSIDTEVLHPTYPLDTMYTSRVSWSWFCTPAPAPLRSRSSNRGLGCGGRRECSRQRAGSSRTDVQRIPGGARKHYALCSTDRVLAMSTARVRQSASAPAKWQNASHAPPLPHRVIPATMRHASTSVPGGVTAYGSMGIAHTARRPQCSAPSPHVSTQLFSHD